jgi:hypothetical protein
VVEDVVRVGHEGVAPVADQVHRGWSGAGSSCVFTNQRSGRAASSPGGRGSGTAPIARATLASEPVASASPGQSDAVGTP